VDRENYKLWTEKTTNCGQGKLQTVEGENYKLDEESYKLRTGKTTNCGEGKLQTVD